MSRTQDKYGHEYKIQAVKLAKEIGGAKAAKELGIPVIFPAFHGIGIFLTPFFRHALKDSQGFLFVRCLINSF
jgi:hypothetical protein